MNRRISEEKYLLGHEKEGNSKYLRKNYYHHIKCIAATFLTAFMWRRPLNNIGLATTTYRKLKGVSDGIGTQVWIQIGRAHV